MSDYSELKRLAEAATAYAEEDWHTPERLFIAMERADAEFVSGCSPFSVLALIAENETTKAQFDECARLFVDATEQACKAQRERDQLKAENEALRKAANELRRFLTCEDVHHDKPDWHEYGEPCKVLARIDAVLGLGDKAGD